MSICARLSANMNGDVSVRHKCGAGGYMPMLSDTNKCKILRVDRGTLDPGKTREYMIIGDQRSDTKPNFKLDASTHYTK